MSLLVVGSVAFDSVETPHGVRDEVLGGSASFFSTAASLLHPVKLVAVVGEDFDVEERLGFLRGRVDLAGLHRAAGRTFRWQGHYGENLNEAHTLDTQLGVFADFEPNLPPAYREAKVVFMANIDPELQLRVLDQVRAPEFTALDTMNFWIEGKRDALLRAIARIQMLTINDAEARMLSGRHNLVQAARAIHDMGPKVVVIKRGEHGALLFTGGRVFSAAAFALEQIKDPTGAGDSFAGGMVGYLARSGDFGIDTLRRAIVVGTILGSFAVEDFSLDRLRALSHSDLVRRYELYKDLVGVGALHEKLL